jgi:hypothetical protein
MPGIQLALTLGVDVRSALAHDQGAGALFFRAAVSAAYNTVKEVISNDVPDSLLVAGVFA